MKFDASDSGLPLVIWTDPYHGTNEASYVLLEKYHDPVRAQFEALADDWNRTTRYFSPAFRVESPAFGAMKQLGDEVLPWAMKRLENDASWILFLENVVPNPPQVSIEDEGVFDVRNKWLEWGRKHAHSHTQG